MLLKELKTDSNLVATLEEVAPALLRCFGTLPVSGATLATLVFQNSPPDVRRELFSINRHLARTIGAVLLGRRHASGQGLSVQLNDHDLPRRARLSMTWRKDREALLERYRPELERAAGGRVQDDLFQKAIGTRIEALFYGLGNRLGASSTLACYLAGFHPAATAPDAGRRSSPSTPRKVVAAVPITKPVVELHGYKQTAAFQKIKGHQADREAGKLRAEFDKRLLQPITLTEQDRAELIALGENPNDPFWQT